LRYTWLIGLRYLRPKHRHFLVSVLTCIATVGVMFAVAAPELTLSVMNGFEKEVRRRIVDTNYNVFVLARGEFRDYRAVMDSLRRHPGVVAVSPFVRREAMLTFAASGLAQRFHGCLVLGVDAARESLTTRVVQAVRPEFNGFDTDLFDVDGRHYPGIVLGVELARELTVSLGDVVTVAAQADSSSGAAAAAAEPHIVQRRFRVVGLLNSGFYEFDAQLAYVALPEAQSFLGFQDRVYGIGVRVGDIYAADRLGAELDAKLGAPYYTNNWMYMFRNVFTWMETERKLMTLVFVVIIAIAAVTVVGMLTMIVMEKRKAIGILKSLGATRAGIMAIFMIQGTAIGMAGAVFGSALGYMACEFVDRIGIDLPGDVYIIDTLPVQMHATDFVVVAAVAVGLCFLATLYPSWEAARLDPVEAIRYE
jgi:lipoprotein-releasing system permease protein